MKNKRLILITNDDGIRAEGLVRLVQAAVKFGEVWVVAPDKQQSGMSHSLMLTEPLTSKEVDFPVAGVRAFCTNGTPSNCVSLGIHAILPEVPDVVLAGINMGYNIATDIQYSGTVGAALEAAVQNVHAIAISQGINGSFELIDHYLEEILEDLIDRKIGRDQVWNVNFPECRLDECKGVKADCRVYKENFYKDEYVPEKISEDGTVTYKTIFARDWKGTEGTDIDAVINNYIAVGIVTNLR